MNTSRREMLFGSLVAATVFAACSLPALGEEKGSWSFQKDSRDYPSLEYRQGDKLIFFIGVGHSVGLWIAYPNASKKPANAATISIQTSSKTWNMKGELINDTAEDFTHADKQVTYFLQWDMGLNKQKPEYDNLSKVYDQFIASIFASKQIIIITKDGKTNLPPVETLPGISLGEARKQLRL